MFSYTRLWHIPGSWALSSFVPSLFPPFRRAPQEFCCLSGRTGARWLLQTQWQWVFEEQLAGGPRSWHAAPFARSLSRSLPKFYPSMLAQGLGRHSSKAGGAGSGQGRRRRMHKEEEETLHHCKGFEFRKKILHNLRYRIDFKKMHQYLVYRVLLQTYF